MTSRQAFVTLVGFTHASSVIAVARRRTGESLTVTRELMPLNTSALPNLPDVVHAALAMVPVPPLPDASATVVPVPSSNEYAATSPDWARADGAAQVKPTRAMMVPTTTRPDGLVGQQRAAVIKRPPMCATSVAPNSTGTK